MYYIALWVAPIFASSYSEMVITPVFETGIQGSIPCKNIWEYGIIDSGRKVKALDLRSGATRTMLWKTMKGIGTPFLEVCGT